jgi:hypothetical protein
LRRVDAYGLFQVFQEVTLQLILDSAALAIISDAAAHARREEYDEDAAARRVRLPAGSLLEVGTVTHPQGAGHVDEKLEL